MKKYSFLGTSGALPYPNTMGTEEQPPESSPILIDKRKVRTPLTSISAYPQVMQVFINHWQTTNASLVGNPPESIILQGGYTVNDLIADRAELLSILNAQSDFDNTREIAAASRDQSKSSMIERYIQVRAAMNTALYGLPEQNSIPKKHHFHSVQTRFLEPFYRLKNLWAAINAYPPSPNFTPPLILGSYTLAKFTSDIESLVELYNEARSAEVDARLNRKMRDSLLPPAKARLQQYKNAVVGRLGRYHPLAATIPLLSPYAGSTPDPVILSVMWDAESNKARLTWSASANQHLDHYEVRSSSGQKYERRSEFTAAHVHGSETEYLTDTGLIAPGSKMWFKVYVVLKTGNERGSNAVEAIRP